MAKRGGGAEAQEKFLVKKKFSFGKPSKKPTKLWTCGKKGGWSTAQANFLSKKSLDMCSGASSKVVFVKEKFVLRLSDELLSTLYLLQNIKKSSCPTPTPSLPVLITPLNSLEASDEFVN